MRKTARPVVWEGRWVPIPSNLPDRRATVFLDRLGIPYLATRGQLPCGGQGSDGICFGFVVDAGEAEAEEF